MGGKVKGRRFLIVLSRDEERIVKAAAEASGEPRATFIRRAAVAQAMESALAIDDVMHHKGAEQVSDEEVYLHSYVGAWFKYDPKWLQYLRVYRAPQVPTADMPQVPPWTQPAVAQRKWAAGRELTLRLPSELKAERQARRRKTRQ